MGKPRTRIVKSRKQKKGGMRKKSSRKRLTRKRLTRKRGGECNSEAVFKRVMDRPYPL
jgi:hypothetical protein